MTEQFDANKGHKALPPMEAGGVCDQLESLPGHNLNLVNLCKDAVKIFAVRDDNSTVQASGTVMSAKGDIISADHDLADKSIKSVDIQFSGGQHRNAELAGRDPKTGLADFHLTGDQQMPQEYFPLKFGKSDDSWLLSPTAAFLYPKRADDAVYTTGQIATKEEFGVLGSDVLQKHTPDLDRSLMAERVMMPTTHGDSGAAVARSDTGDIVGVVQFARTELPPFQLSDPTVLDQALLTPANKVLSFIDKVNASLQNSADKSEIDKKK